MKRRVYPRACGGTAATSPPTSTTAGLSPRLRGNRQQLRGRHRPAGSIPAPAGEPKGPAGIFHRPPVYPRACGGTTTYTPPVGNEYGLSPRLRGNLLGMMLNCPITRSIPAPAGEPAGCLGMMALPMVYPRACGGTRDEKLEAELAEGLSSRLRGNPSELTPLALDDRSIPAPAGEPVGQQARPVRLSVYPRACGGTGTKALRNKYRNGLSPRLRGNQLRDFLNPGQPRSIPAPAGEPCSLTALSASHWVYPRACGGTFCSCWDSLRTGGLSPRLRGNLCAGAPRCKNVRSIPAPAGEPYFVLPARLLATVYPRACGGTVPIVPGNPFDPGLSPRLRGNRCQVPARRVCGRSIPAPAGEPTRRPRLDSSPTTVYPRACGGTAAIAIGRLHADRVYPRACGGTFAL